MLAEIKKLVKSALGHDKPEVTRHNAQYWNELYRDGRWQYLQQLDELAHYSVIVGYCQFINPQARILDVGCGEGILQQKLAFLPYRQYLGLDLSDHAVSIASKNADQRSQFIAADALSFSPENKFDIIIFNESLYCFQDCLPILRHYQKYLSADGVFVISMHSNEVSHHHWLSIENDFNVLDTVKVENQQLTEWQVKTIKPRKT